MKTNSIESVVTAGLCTSCGTCVAICPKMAVSMAETPGGLLFAQVDDAACIACGLCVRACGGAQLAPGLLPDNIDPFKGEVLAAYCGYASDPEIRLRGQSGGVVTALLSFMLESGRIDQALVNRMPDDGTLRPQPFWAHNKKELLSSQGSKYCPVALNTAIPRDIGKDGKKSAIVGLPCHLHSLRNVQKFNAHWGSGIECTIGLFCDRILAFSAMDYLVKKAKFSKKNVINFRYKDKTEGEFPGDICIHTNTGKQVQLPSRERVAIKDLFTPPRCRLCFDKMNVLSDIAVGDAWGVKEGKEGFSVLIARTASALALLEAAQQAGYLHLGEIAPEGVFTGQGVEIRRKQWTAFTKARQDLQNQVPYFGIESKYEDNNIEDIRGFIWDQIRWQDKFLKRKTTERIMRKLEFNNLLRKIKNKLSFNR
ncbi:MAG: Coenzyme F420 hydrogenase/dehydrogenase, beta subunit C-terminal domain [Desulfobulbus sp.]